MLTIQTDHINYIVHVDRVDRQIHADVIQDDEITISALRKTIRIMV